MAYIGKEPIVGNFQKCDALTASGTADYTLQVSSTNVVPESANHMLVSLNGVIQQPGASGGFTVSGSTLSFTSALTSSDTIDFVILLGNVLDVGTVSDATITNAKLAQDIISGETALAAIPATTDEFLISDAGTLKRIDAQFFQNTPAFFAYNASDQTITNNTWTKVVADTEVFDSDGKFASNTFTPTVAAKYYAFGSVFFDDGDHNNELELQFYKNGSAVTNPKIYHEKIPHDNSMVYILRINGIIDLDSDDYVELFVKHNVGSNQVLLDDYTTFGAYKLIGI